MSKGSSKDWGSEEDEKEDFLLSLFIPFKVQVYWLVPLTLTLVFTPHFVTYLSIIHRHTQRFTKLGSS